MGLSCSRTGSTEADDLPLQLQVEHVLSVSRSRGAWLPPEKGQPTPVRLSVYDAQESSLRQAFMVTGPPNAERSLHCGVEVHHCEWSYGGEQRQWGSDWQVGPKVHPTGITCCVPRESPGHAFSESVLLGRTSLSEEDVLHIIQALGRAWAAADHHPVTRSCLHFSDALCQLLGVGRVPEQVRRLAAELRGGCPLACCGSSFCSSRSHGAADPPGAGQELLVLRRQLEQATVQLQQAQRDLACERASHDEAIRQVLEMKRAAAAGSPRGNSNPPSSSPGRTLSEPL